VGDLEITLPWISFFQKLSTPSQRSLPMKQEARFVVFGLLAWLCFALAVGVSGKIYNVSAPAVAATVWLLTGLALVACWKIPHIRHWVTDIDLRWLIAVHLTRFVGAYFLVLAARGRLPDGFARPAGIGDIAIATSAVVILFVPQLLVSRRVLLTWNGLGLLDILFVAFAALRFGLRDLQSMAPLRELPLSLLPTFIVPLIIASHVLIFVRLKVDAAASRVLK
jgi:hypothetical protein